MAGLVRKGVGIVIYYGKWLINMDIPDRDVVLETLMCEHIAN